MDTWIKQSFFVTLGVVTAYVIRTFILMNVVDNDQLLLFGDIFLTIFMCMFFLNIEKMFAGMKE